MAHADINAEKTWRHIVNRGARKLPIFGEPADCRSFIALLREATEKTDAECHGFALMPNHFHLLVLADSDAAARMMQFVSATYTRRFNRKYGYDGSLLRSRYHRTVIDDERYLLSVVRYIHNNPMAAEGNHRMLHTFRWTSHPAYLSGGPDWIKTDSILTLAGGRQAYRDLISSGLPADAEVRQPKPVRTRLAALTAIEDAVGVGSPSERAALASGGRGIRNRERLAAILLAADHSQASCEMVAERYGFGSTASLRSAVSRARKLLPTDPDLAELVENATRRLLA